MPIQAAASKAHTISFTIPADKPWELRWHARFTGPDNTTLNIPGYFDGSGQVCRFTLPVEGEWSCEAFIQGENQPCAKEIIQAGPGEDPLSGGLKVNSRNKKRFTLGEDDSYFLLSYECNWLWAIEMKHPGSGRVDAFLKRIKSYGFNSVLMNAYAHDCTWALGNTSPFDFGPPGIFPWGGSNEAPDFSCFNPEYWKRFDTVVEAFQNNGMILHLYFKVFNKLVNWPEQGSEEEKEFFRYITARYQAYSCMIWDFSKEAYYEQDKNRISELMLQVKKDDAYGRLRTIHDYPSYYRRDDAMEILDFITVQQHHNFHGSVLLEHKDHDWPYMNAEFGYECGGGGITDVTYGVGQTAQTLIERAWEVALSGGYPAYYYTNTAWDVIHEDEIPQGYGFFKIMADFFKKHNFSQFEPYQDDSLWRSSFTMTKGDTRQPEELLMFIDWHILVPERLSFDKYEGSWLNIYNGDERALDSKSVQPCVDRKEYTIYEIPFTAPYAVLHLKRREA